MDKWKFIAKDKVGDRGWSVHTKLLRENIQDKGEFWTTQFDKILEDSRSKRWSVTRGLVKNENLIQYQR